MKQFISPLFMLLMLLPGLASCSTNEPELPLQTEQPAQPNVPDNNDSDNNNNDSTMSNKLNIRIGTSVFTATLADNATAKAFRSLLPLTLNMAELNSNEKYFNLSSDLPTASSRPGTIRTGDLMLFGSNTLVLFYETFSSSYSYTPMGRIDNPTELAHVLGSGYSAVTFETANYEHKSQR